ncbi:MAG: DegV family protein [Christensenellales bacterium]
MSKVKIITDSNSGILQSEAKELGIVVIPMPFTVDGEEYLEELTMTQDEFYEKLEKGAEVRTSQPSLIYLNELCEEALETYDEVVYIPMSSGLSATCENSKTFVEKFNGKVQVVDNLRISLSQKESVFEAIEMAKEGKSATKIKEYLEETKHKASIYITLSVLKYLKKGGRISPTAAAIGSVLNVKPILYTRGGKFEKFSMALTFAQAKKKMLNQIKSECENEFKEEYEQGKMVVSVAHTRNEKEALKFKEEIMNELPKAKFRFIDPLSLSVSCHIGPGSLAICLCINNYLK